MKLRSALIMAAISAGIVGAMTGLPTAYAETRGADLAASPCVHIAWPKIPSACLEGGRGYDVRMIDAGTSFEDASAATRLATELRFDAAFQ